MNAVRSVPVYPFVLILAILVALGTIRDVRTCLAATTLTAKAISGGWGHSLAVKPDGTVWIWGATPTQVAGLADVKSVAAGWGSSLALKNDGSIWAWGNNSYGQLGDGTTTDRSAPVEVTGLSDVKAVAASGYHSMALKNDGTVWAWGRNDDGQIGDGSTIDRYAPVRVVGLSDISAIDGDGYHSLALKNDGTVWAWGQGYYTGQASTASQPVPAMIPGLSDVKAIASGPYLNLALKNDGTVWAWGVNFNYVDTIGDGGGQDRKTPVQIPGLANVVEISVPGIHALVRRADGVVLAWGLNDNGQLGLGIPYSQPTPVPVPGLSDVTRLDGGLYHSLALKSDGSVWTWGSNESFQLGDGTHTDRYSPVQVSVPSSCATTVSPTNPAEFLREGGQLTLTVTSPPGCSWTATACKPWNWRYPEPWIEILSGASGVGNGQVVISVEPNMLYSRQDHVAVAGHTFYIRQAAACPSNISPSGAQLLTAAGTGSVRVFSSSDCDWSAVSDVSWIRLTAGASGTDYGVISYEYDANPDPEDRSGQIVITGSTGLAKTFFVEQRGACFSVITPQTAQATYQPGSGSIEVTVNSGCPWTAVSNDAWITVTGGGSGTGDGQVSYAYSTNTSGTPRTGTITVAGRTFSLTQDETCQFAFNPASVQLGSSLALGSASLFGTQGCPFTAVSNADWLAITSGASGTGDGQIGYGVSLNASGSSRTGTITAGGATFTVTQAGSNVPTALLDGLPAQASPCSAARITVSGQGVTSYKYRIDSGDYGPETAVATPIVLSGLSRGDHAIYVLAKDALGVWQIEPTTYAWSVSPVPPLAPGVFNLLMK